MMRELSDKKRVVCLAGPTASGKSDLALAIAQKRDVEIISVDSALVYRGMDIGTAKPSADILKAVPHHLINICDPKEAYSVARFRQEALQIIDAVIERGRLPLLVGGTMLYYHALLHGLAPLPEAQPVLRDEITQRGLKEGWDVLHRELQSLDPKAAARIHLNDPKRIQRALEVCLTTGKSLSTHLEKTQALDSSYVICMLGLIPEDRSLLHARIEKRFHEILEQGFLDEVAALHARTDLSADLPSIRAVGYRQAWAYLEGSLNYDQMREKSVVATRQLAKRQLTWLRNWPDLTTFDCFNSNLLSKVLTLL